MLVIPTFSESCTSLFVDTLLFCQNPLAYRGFINFSGIHHATLNLAFPFRLPLNLHHLYRFPYLQRIRFPIFCSFSAFYGKAFSLLVILSIYSFLNHVSKIDRNKVRLCACGELWKSTVSLTFPRSRLVKKNPDSFVTNIHRSADFHRAMFWLLHAIACKLQATSFLCTMLLHLHSLALVSYIQGKCLHCRQLLTGFSCSAPCVNPFYAIRSTLSRDFFEFRKKFFDLAKSPDKRKDYQTFPACKELVTLDKCRISKHEKLSSCFFRKNKKYLSNKNRYLQAPCLQVPEKIEKNKLRKEDKK